jgi:hypothetical protein
MGDHWFDAVMFLRNNVLVGAVVVAAILALALLFLRWRRQVALERAQHWPESVLEPPGRSSATMRLRGHTTKLHTKEE